MLPTSLPQLMLKTKASFQQELQDATSLLHQLVSTCSTPNSSTKSIVNAVCNKCYPKTEPHFHLVLLCQLSVTLKILNWTLTKTVRSLTKTQAATHFHS